MRRSVAVVALAMLVAACDVSTIPPSIPGPSRLATAPPRQTEAPAETVSTEPPSDDVPTRPDPATFLQVCRDLGQPSGDPAPCSDLVEAALAAPELAGARIRRVDLGGSCDPPSSCGRATPVATFPVTVLSDRKPVLVELVRAADGSLVIRGLHAALPPRAPAFTPPATGLADLPGAPASLASRPAYPLCGQEQAPMGGPYDDAARRCFLAGVLAGSSVEFATVGSGTEGGAIVDLYRFAGTGGIEHVTGEAGTWTRTFTGIGEAGGGLVFKVDGMSTRPEPLP